MKRLRIPLKYLPLVIVLSAVAFASHFVFFQKNFIFACRSCHEMRSHSRSLKLASHDRIQCRKCHHIYPVARMARVKFFEPGKKYQTVRVSNADCSRCHPHIKESKVFYHDVRFSHKKHIESKHTCSTCHKFFVHRKSKKSPLITFRQCRDCHERERGVNPPFSIRDLGALEKQPHLANWYVEHKDTAAKDKKPCMECHKKKFCDHCHGSYRSHIKSWWVDHHKDAMKNLAECQICHRPDYCISCHKQNIPKTHTPKWGMAHWKDIDLKNCNKCHTLNFCKSCHTQKKPASHKTIKDHAGMKPEREALCDICHGKNSCSTCHHKPKQTTPCAQCHKGPPETVAFQGRTLSHKRHAQSARVDCVLCHVKKAAGPFETSADCRTCHHKTGRYACVRCHAGAAVRAVKTKSGSFSHKSHASGRGISCVTCHKASGSGVMSAAADCNGCHHGGRYKTACTRCHGGIAEKTVSVRGMSMSHANHANTRGIACGRCHVPSASRKGMATRYDCGACHHTGAGKRCGVCHAQQWRASDSGPMDFPCDLCHVSAGQGFAAAQGKCRSCHAAVYGQENHGGDASKPPAACVKCHRPHAWKASR